MGGSSTTSSQNNSPMNSLSPSPPDVDRDSTITIDFDRIHPLEDNQRDFEGFLNQENVLPQVGNIVNTLRDILILDQRGLVMLTACLSSGWLVRCLWFPTEFQHT